MSLLLISIFLDMCKIDLSYVVPTLALIISIKALVSNINNAKKNIRLSITQAIFKSISEKAKDCNTLWEKESDKSYENATHYTVMSELIITKEIINKSLDLFSKNDEKIELLKDDFYWLLWKQLRTDLRGWIIRTPEIVKQMDPRDEIYSKQVSDLQEIFQKHFE